MAHIFDTINTFSIWVKVDVCLSFIVNGSTTTIHAPFRFNNFSHFVCHLTNFCKECYSTT